MSDEEIRKYLQRQTPGPVRTKPVRMRAVPRSRRQAPVESFKDFSATHLLCPKCKQAMPVRERLLLVLSDGDLYDYVCQSCGSSCGTRKAGR